MPGFCCRVGVGSVAKRHAKRQVSRFQEHVPAAALDFGDLSGPIIAFAKISRNELMQSAEIAGVENPFNELANEKLVVGPCRMSPQGVYCGTASLIPLFSQSCQSQGLPPEATRRTATAIAYSDAADRSVRSTSRDSRPRCI
jgi:hypothetical protein